MPFGANKFLQTTHNVGLGAIHALIQRLEGEIVAVAVDHQAWQLVAFAMHQAVSLRIRHHALPMSLGRGDAAQVKRAVNRLHPLREHPQRYLGGFAVVRGPKRGISTWIGHHHGLAPGSLSAIQDIAGENPGMAGCHPVGPFSVNPDVMQVLSLEPPSVEPRTALPLFFMAVLRTLTNCLLLAVSLLVPGYLAAQGPQFSIQDLGTLPNLPACNGTALSQSGDVVGYCTATAGQNLLLNGPATHVFLYSKGAMTDLNITSPATGVFPTGVNDADTVVGGAIQVNLTSVTAAALPFIYQNGAVQSPSGPIENTLPLAVNDAGQMVATSLQVGGGSGGKLNLNFFVESQAFLDPLSGGAVTQLAAPAGGGSGAAFGINSSGVVAGASVAQNASVVNPLLWTNATPKALPLLSGYSNAIATSVNDSGVAAGLAFSIDFTTLTANGTAHAVLFDNGAVSDLGVLSGDASSAAMGINNSGTVVGFSNSQPPSFALQLAGLIASPASKFRAFVYSGGTMYNLNNQLVNGSGWQLSFATQINNAGQIVGTGLFTGSDGTAVQHAFLLTPTTPNISNIVGAGFSTPAVTSISPNGIFTIFGTQLAAAKVALTGSDIVNNELPTNLGGTCVESGTTKWGLFYVSPTQINVIAEQLPASGTAPVTVVTGCGTAKEVSSPVMNVPVAAVSPEFLYFLENTDGQNPVAAIDAITGAYIGASGLISGATFTPAKAGELVTAFGVGWGPTTPSNQPGTVASATATLSSTYSFTLGGAPVDVQYAGLSPTYAGLYQVNFTVPSGLSAGNQPLVLKVDGVSTSATAYIDVSN